MACWSMTCLFVPLQDEAGVVGSGWEERETAGDDGIRGHGTGCYPVCKVSGRMMVIPSYVVGDTRIVSTYYSQDAQGGRTLYVLHVSMFMLSI